MLHLQNIEADGPATLSIQFCLACHYCRQLG